MTTPGKLKVQNTDLVRDVHSKAILVTDISAYELYKKRKNRELQLLAIEKKLDKILALKEEEANVQA